MAWVLFMFGVLCYAVYQSWPSMSGYYKSLNPKQRGNRIAALCFFVGPMSMAFSMSVTNYMAPCSPALMVMSWIIGIFGLVCLLMSLFLLMFWNS